MPRGRARQWRRTQSIHVSWTSPQNGWGAHGPLSKKIHRKPIGSPRNQRMEPVRQSRAKKLSKKRPPARGLITSTAKRDPAGKGPRDRGLLITSTEARGPAADGRP